MTSSLDEKSSPESAVQGDELHVLLWFGALMLRSGNTAIRTREWLEVMAQKMGPEAVSISLSLDSITASVRRSGEWVTAMREIGPPGVNAWRIDALEQLARRTRSRLTPHELAIKLAEIESAPPLYSHSQTAAAIAVASGGFAFLNGGAAPEMILAGIAGGVGQWSRSWLAGHRLNQYGVAALSAIVASGVYVVTVNVAGHSGLQFAHHPAGFISSVLFLVPGFPLIAALFDLLQLQTVAAVSRLAYGVMILLAVSFGLSVVIAIAGVGLWPHPQLELAYPLKLLLRAIASFGAGCSFAVLFNSSTRTVFAVGFLATGANELRLALHDFGLMLAPAAFFAALAVGFLALLVDQRFNIPRMAMIVPAIVIMIPGVYAFEMIVLFNRGDVLEALQASAVCGFVIGALAMGLATARFLSER